ncbi:hypothetical protein FISHEDRAFT_14196, partial [Fistulina hepatica ATCC 64428]
DIATMPAPVVLPSVATSAAVRINILWFLSLVLSLDTALMGLLCKQWIRQFLHSSGRTGEDALAIRQLQFEGVVAWHVAAIVSSVPLLPQVTLILFLVSLVDLLWSIELVLAGVVTAVISIVLGFYIFTTVALFLQMQLLSIITRFCDGTVLAQCTYKSPQSLFFL